VSNWPSVALGEVVTFENGDRGKDYPKVGEFKECGIPFINAGHLERGRVDLGSVNRITESKFDQLRSGKVRSGDLLYCLRGSPGRVAKVCDLDRAAIASSLVIIRGSERAEANYLYYLLSGSFGRQLVVELNNGSAQPNISVRSLQGYSIPLPPLPEQRTIASILGALDDKIDLNRRMNETLEAMARAIFKSWFVDFDPVRAKAEGKQPFGIDADTAALFPDRLVDSELGPIPEGWEVTQAKSIVARLKAGKRFTKKTVETKGKVPVFEQGASLLLGFHNGEPDIVSSSESPRFLFGDHTCITHLSTASFSVGPNVIPLKAEGRDAYWTYFAIRDLQEFQEYRRHWMEFAIKSVLVPENDICSAFGQLVRRFYASQEANSAESRTLAELRDLLLPKLLSGEIRVKEAEKIVEDAV
jgi:type I restriction enzyme, S subunit